MPAGFVGRMKGQGVVPERRRTANDCIMRGLLLQGHR